MSLDFNVSDNAC